MSDANETPSAAAMEAARVVAPNCSRCGGERRIRGYSPGQWFACPSCLETGRLGVAGKLSIVHGGARMNGRALEAREIRDAIASGRAP